MIGVYLEYFSDVTIMVLRVRRYEHMVLGAYKYVLYNCFIQSILLNRSEHVEFPENNSKSNSLRRIFFTQKEAR